MGYHQAGFEVVGVDRWHHRKYPFRLVVADAMTYPLEGFDLIHASPPCQRYTKMTGFWDGGRESYPDLIPDLRVRVQQSGIPWVIENVPGSPLRNPVELCGHMFGLALYRHRWFETNWPLPQPDHVPHTLPTSRAGHWKPGTIISVAGHFAPAAVAREAMGIDWMGRNDLREAIPPAYTRYVGEQWAVCNITKVESGVGAGTAPIERAGNG